MSKIVIGLDCEVADPLLKTAGYSWKYNQGYILCTALYYSKEDRVEIIAGMKNDNCPFSPESRTEDNAKIKALLQDENVCIVGANLQYDIGWLLYEFGMSTYDVKCSFVDVLQAEALLDEFGIHSLESVSKKYLKSGKKKDRIETYIRDNISKKGDFRQHLKDATWDLLCEYVEVDAKNPVKIWTKQLALLKEQDLCKRVKLEFDCILPTLQMTMTGMPIDVEQKNTNMLILSTAIDTFRKQFISKYNLPNFRVTASKDIADFCDKRNIPYKYKITLTGCNGTRFANGVETDKAYMKAKQIVSQFRLVKGQPVALVSAEMADRTLHLLEEEGFDFNCSPNIDKKFFESKSDAYPEIALIANWKLAEGIKSKILGEEYNRFICKNFKGETVVKPQFKITDTISFRYSSNMPNCIAGDMKVLTPKGWKRIDKLSIGEEIYNGNGDVTIVSNIWKKGVQNCLLTISANGYRIVTTPEHKVWTGNEEREIKDCEQIGTIERRTDCKIIPLYADKRADSRCNRCEQRKSNGSIEEELDRKGVYRTENTAQNKNSKGLHRPRGKSTFCGRIYISTKTLFQRTLYKIQDFFKQRKKLFEKTSNRGREARTAQYESITSKVSEECILWKTSAKLQRHLCRPRRVYFSLHSFFRRRDKQSKIAQESICGGFGDRCALHTSEPRCSSYRHKPLKQQLGQLGFVFKASTQKVTQTVTRPREVYDIEVASEDHSFICEGFRVFNCQQIPSKSGFSLPDGKVEYSFPKLTRALFTASKGCVFGKIDYGQIEYRLICNIACGTSGDEVRRQYAENPSMDFHQYVVDLTGLDRKLAKNMSFGVSFGMSLTSMAETFGWTKERAEEIAEAYHNNMPFVAPTLALVGDVAKKRGYIKTAYGSRARLLDQKKSYTMLNRYTQGSGAECLKLAIVKAYKEGVWETLKVANTIHDELNMPYLEPTEDKMRALYRMAEIMKTSMPNLKVPLEAEIEIGDNWAETKEIKEWINIRENNKEIWENTSNELKKAVAICEGIKNDY